ncbi:MAG: hypothetical protein R2715_22405 [Ilumatobacteraceae bacterium]
MAAKKQPVQTPKNPYQTSTNPDELSPANRVAFEITDRRDLMPSVDRIMNAGLEEPACGRALTRFRDSLSNMGDPHRDPHARSRAWAAASEKESPA